MLTKPGSPELQPFLEAMTTNETFFFRHRVHWDIFIAEIARCAKPPRVWNAAACTGEEAYSAAIACGEHHASGKAEIIATDLNRKVLAQAQIYRRVAA